MRSNYEDGKNELFYYLCAATATKTKPQNNGHTTLRTGNHASQLA